MAYLVLARKYRPKTFDEVVGQQTVTRTLRNAIATGRIGHAFLLSGARGVGKTSSARLLAKALNCSKADGPTPEELPVLGEHLAYLQGLARQGKLLLAGRTTTEDDRVFGLALLDVDDEIEAQALMEADPAVRHGLMRAELFPFRIAVQR